MKMKDIISAPAFLSMTGSLMAVCLMAAGCSSSRIDPEETEGEMISFSSSLSAASEVAATKTGAGSTLIDTDAELQGQPFGIYGDKSMNNDFTDSKSVFSSNAAQKVYYTTTELSWNDDKGNTHTVDANTWTYDDHKKWERAMHYRFRAYWPFSAKVNSASTANFLAVEYRQVEDYDLMVAYATRYPMTEGVDRVPMTFKHALSGLRFKFKFKDGLTNASDKVTGFYMTGLYLTGTMIYGEAAATDSTETIRWNINENTFDDGSTSAGTKIFNWTGSETFSVGSTAGDVTVATIFDNDRAVFAIPQTLSEYDYRETWAHFTTESGGTAVQSVKIWDYAKDESVTLKPGKIYTFTFVIGGSSVKVNIDIEDWTETQSNIDIYF